jgi:predicted ABC-type ATPase
MGETSPIAMMLAGANGAGKTTTAMTLFRDALRSVHYVNADTIAQGLSGGAPDSVALQAGAIMLKRLHQLAAERKNLAFETTGASRSFATWIRQLKSAGYEYDLYFFWLRSADVAIERVAERVRSGGHNVPIDTIRRRYEGGLKNFFKLYLPLATNWQIIDNNDVASPHPIAAGKEGCPPIVQDAMLWDDLKARYDS